MKSVRTIIFLLTTLVCIPYTGVCQIRTDIELLTSQEKQQLKLAKSVVKELKQVIRQFKKDSTRISKKIKKELKHQGTDFVNQQISLASDSLRDHYNIDRYESLLGQYQGRDNIKKKVRDEALDYGEEKLKENISEEELGAYREQVEHYTGDLSKYKEFAEDPEKLREYLEEEYSKVDKIAEDRIRQMEEIRALEKQKMEAELLKMPRQYREQFQRYQASLKNRDQFKKEVAGKAVTVAQTLIQKHEGKISEAMKKLSRLKKKYTYVPTANDLSNARKKSSLQGEPLRKRLQIGGTFQLHRGQPTALDFSPLVAYRFNKNFSAGIGGTYRGSYDLDTKYTARVAKQVYGYRGFLDLKVYKSYKVHAEYERLNTEIFDKQNDVIGRTWSVGALAGFLKEYKISHALNGAVLVLYNFNYNNKSPYSSPWVIRAGINLSGDKNPIKQKARKLEEGFLFD